MKKNKAPILIESNPSAIYTEKSRFTFLSRLSIKLLTYSFIATLIIIITLLVNHYTFTFLAKDKIYTSVQEIPSNKVGLVLGTSKYYRSGNLNQYYKSRIEGAFELFSQGKINYFLLSGDNRVSNYNEPSTMRKDLISKGVDPSYIFLDFAGFRTLDSVIRAKSVFQTPSYTIITQRFHCERALFIARFNNIDATCFAVPDPYSGVVHYREILARAKATIDIFLLNKEPYFLGPNIYIPSEQELAPSDLDVIEQPDTRKNM
ncbi:SanA/YdcF family protein [Thorsellia kenyensis]|uniref:Vancomycin high temperature exclusion protein n=1 Tax=Thorsellia kenyensis TaxID=1549888 RepID=A0ABV6CA16_9GAMM